MSNDVCVRLSSLTPKRIEWRSEGRLAKGKITVIDGDPGGGKSTMLMDWVAKISSGQALPNGQPGKERGVVLLSAEDDPEDTILPRLIAAGGDPDEVLVLNEIPVLTETGEALIGPLGVPEKRMFGLPDDAAMLEQIVIDANAALVIVDPIFAFLSPDISGNSDQDIRRALSPLATIAQRTGASIVLVRHLNKSGGVKALYRGGGSIGIIGLARIGLLLGRAKDDPELRVLAPVKNNIGKPAPSLGFGLVSVPGTDVARAEYRGEVAYTADDLLLGEILSDVESDERSDTERWLHDYLASSPRQATDVFREGQRMQFSKNSIKEAKLALGIKPRKSGFDGGWIWELPKLVYHEQEENEEAL